MAFTEDLDTYFADFTDTVVYSGTTYKGILDEPDEMIADGIVLATDYQLTAKTSDFGTLIAGESITVDSVAYTVREVRKLDDGSFVEISLQKT